MRSDLANARLATVRRIAAGPGRGRRRPDRQRMAAGSSMPARRRCPAVLTRRDDRLPGPLDHAGPDRLAIPISSMAAIAPTNSSCGWKAPAMRRSRGPAAASSRRCARRARLARTSSSRAPCRRLDALIAEGVTTIEIKSGYGLDRRDELKSLRAARSSAAYRPVAVTTTFLGAHALPPESAGDTDALHRP